MDRRNLLAIVAVALSLAGCKSSTAGDAPGIGKLVYGGAVRALAPAPDGSALALLDGCAELKATFLPPGTARCDLRIVPAAGGEAAKVAGGVMTLPASLSWRPDGKALVAMAEADLAQGTASLVEWREGKSRTLAEGVTFQGYGGHGELGFVSGGRLSVMLPGELAPRAVAGGDRVASFDLSPSEFPRCGAEDGPRVRIVARRAQPAGGELLYAGCGLDALAPLEHGEVGDYGFSKSGASLAYTRIGKEGEALRAVQTGWSLASATLGSGARAFAFGPDGVTLAFIADAAPGRQGNLHLGGVGRKDVVLAREVGEFRWANAAPRLAWLEKYDPRVRAGTVGAGGPDLPPRTIADNVTDIELSPDGEHLAFLEHTSRGGYSVDLLLARVGAPAGERPLLVAPGTFGFAFSPDGRWLYYRTRCIRNGDACDLERIPAAGLAQGGKPELIAPGVKSFDFDPRDPGRLLIGWQRKDMVALDVGVWSAGRLTSVDTAVLPGSARFLGPDSARVAYVVVKPKRQGAYVADLPR